MRRSSSRFSAPPDDDEGTCAALREASRELACGSNEKRRREAPKDVDDVLVMRGEITASSIYEVLPFRTRARPAPPRYTPTAPSARGFRKKTSPGRRSSSSSHTITICSSVDALASASSVGVRMQRASRRRAACRTWLTH